MSLYRLILSLLLLQFALPLQAQTKTEPATLEQEQLPAGVKPLPPHLRERIRQIQSETERYRGLKLGRPVRMGLRDEESLKRKMLDMFHAEMPPEKIRPLENTLKNFRLIPPQMDLGSFYPKLLTSQVAGYYEPKGKYLVLVDREGGMLGQQASQFKPEVALMLEESTLAHEITHAIQDKHFNLEQYGHDTPLSDRAIARLALIEGDAMHVTYSYMMKIPIETVPGISSALEQFALTPEQMLEALPDMPGMKELNEAPAYIRENLLFSYIQGFVFNLELRKVGGQKLLDYAFAKDPPSSSEQIMHPQKWYKIRDEPVRIELPDLANILTGYEKVSTGSWGEFNTRLLLLEQLGPRERERCNQAAAGWGGDTFALFEKDKRQLLLWLTAWDTKTDALEFAQAVKKAFPQWDLSQPEERKVNLVAGDISEETLARLHAVLTGASYTFTEPRPFDLSAIGISEADKPQPLSFAQMQRLLTDPGVAAMMQMQLGDADANLDFAKMMQNPALQELVRQMSRDMPMLQGIDLGKMLNDPNFQKMASDLMQSMLEGGKLPIVDLKPPERKDAMGNGSTTQSAAEPDLSKLMRNPEVLRMANEMAQKMLQGENLDLQALLNDPGIQRLAGRLSGNDPQPTTTVNTGKITDGIYKNTQFGLQVAVPDAFGWKVNERFADLQKAAHPLLPDPLIAFSSAGGRAQIAVTAKKLPVAITQEQLPATLQMGARMLLTDFKTYGQGKPVETDGIKGYDFQFGGEAAGQATRSRQRAYLIDQHLIVVMASTPMSEWDQFKEAIDLVFNSIGFAAEKK